MLMLLIGLAGCKKEEGQEPPSGPPTSSGPVDVYVVGHEQVGGDILPKVWKNGQETTLPTSAGKAYATDVFVASGSVYVAGFHQETVDNVPVLRKDLWIDGVPQWLPFDTVGGVTFPDSVPAISLQISESAEGVFVDGSDVYLVVRRNEVITQFGNVLDDHTFAYYMKNGDPEYVGPGLPTDIAVANGTVYTSGFRSNEAVYWENDVEHALTDGSSGDSQAMAIVVEGGNVHVVGSDLGTGQRKAKYWLNGVETTLTTGTNHEWATGISVEGTTVRVCGYEWTMPAGAKSAAKVWTNGVEVYLTDGTQSIAEASAIATNGSNVLVGGTEDFILGVPQSAMLWTNGNGTVLSPTGTDAWVNAIAVVPQ